MIELVAELRERLRLFAPGGLSEPAGRREPGPLDLGERLALTARILADGLEVHGGREAGELPDALRQLAGAAEHVPAPLSHSEVAASLEELVRVMDDLACAWDRRRQVDLTDLWRRVREAGDRVWSRQEEPERPAPPVVRGRQEIWLLVTGALRRNTLQHRLGEAGYAVVTLSDHRAVVDRMQQERPVAVLCDDAAPGRFHHRLRSLWPDQSPPLVLVRAGNGRSTGAEPAWMPPYRSEDLRALLS